MQIHKLGEKLMFFINDTRAANQLKQLGQVQSRDGPLSIFVKQCPPPKSSLQGNKQCAGVNSASWTGGRSGPGSRDDDDIMEEDPTEVVKVRVPACFLSVPFKTAFLMHSMVLFHSCFSHYWIPLFPDHSCLPNEIVLAKSISWKPR